MDNPLKHLSIVSKSYAVLGWLLLACSIFFGWTNLAAAYAYAGPIGRLGDYVGLCIVSFAVTLALMIFSVGLIFCGHAVKKRKHHGCCWMFAALLCAFIPIGTGFGAYFLYVLLDLKTVRIFEAARAYASETHLPPNSPPSLPPSKLD
jgi:MFS family permease